MCTVQRVSHLPPLAPDLSLEALLRVLVLQSKSAKHVRQAVQNFRLLTSSALLQDAEGGSTYLLPVRVSLSHHQKQEEGSQLLELQKQVHFLQTHN